MKLYNLSSFLMLYESLKYFLAVYMSSAMNKKYIWFPLSDVWYILDTTSVFLA